VAYKKYGSPSLRYLFHLAKALTLKFVITDRQDLIHDQNLRLKMGCNCECETHMHPAAVSFDWSIQESLDPGKVNNFIEAAAYVGLRHSQYCAVQENVLSPGQFGMKSSSYFQ
jgi:hypothetical protein